MIELPALNQSLLNGGQLFVFVYRPNFTARPDVQLSLGSNLLASNIKEGDDVYFDCRASALPPVTRLEWFHNVSYSLDRWRLSSRAYNLLNKRLPSSSKFNLCFLSFPKCFGRRHRRRNSITTSRPASSPPIRVWCCSASAVTALGATDARQPTGKAKRKATSSTSTSSVRYFAQFLGPSFVFHFLPFILTSE